MTTCFDIYVMPSSCDTIWAYPSQVHPPTPSQTSGGGSRAHTETWREQWHHDDDESILAALGLFGPDL